jgi:hypothetical protein
MLSTHHRPNLCDSWYVSKLSWRQSVPGVDRLVHNTGATAVCKLIGQISAEVFYMTTEVSNFPTTNCWMEQWHPAPLLLCPLNIKHSRCPLSSLPDLQVFLSSRIWTRRWSGKPQTLLATLHPKRCELEVPSLQHYVAD